MKLSHHVGPLGGHYELDRKGRERLHCQGILGGWYYEQDDNFGLPDSITNPQYAYSYDDEDDEDPEEEYREFLRWLNEQPRISVKVWNETRPFLIKVWARLFWGDTSVLGTVQKVAQALLRNPPGCAILQE